MLRFGTDGVRGDAETDLTSALIVAFGSAVAQVMHAPRALIGRDTRESGVRIEHELTMGLRLEGTEAIRLGVLPTPAIAFTAQRAGVPAFVVSASHNPWTDNGVKVIGPDGRKLSDDTERAIEEALARLAGGGASTYGTVEFALDTDAAANDAYLAHLVGALEGRLLTGLRVVLDCANGAASAVGPDVLRAAGADVTVLHAEPNGRNINDACGSTYPDTLRAAVRDAGADLGLALDGDADRVLAVDERGELVDGDQIMTMLALDLRDRGHLRNDAIAITVMTNLGLRHALRDAGITVVETPVGDRHVVAAMQEHDLVLGGEQSGHIILAEHATTGDGLLTGLLVCDLVARSGRPLSALGAQMTRLPQILVNVRVARAVDVTASSALRAAVDAVERQLGDNGRVVVRASGTEPLVRVMIEAPSHSEADAAAQQLRSVVESEFGSS